MIDETKLSDKIYNAAKDGDFDGMRPLRVLMGVNNMILDMPKVGEWIPCSERLPETSGIYIVDDRRGGNKWVHLAGFALESQSWCENQGVCFDDVFGRYDNGRIVAWMPLPKPWEGEEA